MEDFNELITQLRELVDARHKAGHAAIDALVASFTGPALPSISPVARHSATGRNGASLQHNSENPGTNVAKVLASIKSTCKTVPDIARDTGLDERQVRGVLYNKFVASRTESRRIRKRVWYVVKEAADILDKAEADELFDL